MSRRPSPPVLLAIVVAEIVLARAARRDLALRPDAELRGNRGFWRVFVVLNPGNALVYFLAGRRWGARPRRG